MIYTLDRFRKVGHHVVCHVILHDCMITCQVDPESGLEFFTSTLFMCKFQEKRDFTQFSVIIEFFRIYGHRWKYLRSYRSECRMWLPANDV